jgi:hypothetical protein
MRKQNILRTFLFIVFFSIGASALSVSILCDDLVRYYRNNQLLKAAEESLRRLEVLNADYGALLEQLQKEPNAVERIAPATLGTELEAEGTIYPKATAEQLASAKKALSEEASRKVAEPVMPDWLVRCSKPPQRVILFLAGAFLILISFIWFGPVSRKANKDGFNSVG